MQSYTIAIKTTKEMCVQTSISTTIALIKQIIYIEQSSRNGIIKNQKNIQFFFYPYQKGGGQYLPTENQKG